AAPAARHHRSPAGIPWQAGVQHVGRHDRCAAANGGVAASAMTADPLESVQRIADAVLFEGYVLYPYRASAAKNLYRWQFGVVAPRAPREDAEPWFTQTEFVLRGARQLFVRVRFLRPAGQEWLEGVPHSIDLGPQPLDMTAMIPLADAGIAAQLTMTTEQIDSFVRVRMRIENLEPWRAEFDVDRDAMLRHALVGTHLL